MSTSIEQTVIEGLRQLTLEQQKEVADFIQQLMQKNAPRKTLWEKIDARVKQVPSEVWEGVPADGAEPHD